MKKIPKTVAGLAGPIKVFLHPTIEKAEDGSELVGRWYTQTREIHVSSTQTPREQWRTFYHELVHAALADSGMTNLLTYESEESIADLIGAARMIEDGL